MECRLAAAQGQWPRLHRRWRPGWASCSTHVGEPFLIRRRGWKDITIIEKKEVIGAEDNQRSYVSAAGASGAFVDGEN
eukprot:1160118-Pelagomonas_calceolata.AAC.11